MNLICRNFSSKMNPQPIKSKFRGSLLGSLMGDCLGAPFEGNEVSSGDKIIIQRYFDKMEKPEFKGPFKKYTDDTAMMKSVAKFLTDKPEPDFKHLARLFVTEFFNQPKRGYGQNVVDVFDKLKNSKYEDVFKPAKEQFGGFGSYGNGGAMRIAPIPLFFYDDYDNMVNVAQESTKITHSNSLGIHGAVLQCLAIHQAFLTDCESPINAVEFLKNLQEKMCKIEGACYEDMEEADLPYYEKLHRVEALLSRKHSDQLDDEVIMLLGNGISAYESVTTAIYCFLRAQNEIPGVETANKLRRTIQYAINLGGDTDTIACMAGAIVGAHLGEEAIDKDILNHCERPDDISAMADNLYEARCKSKS